MRNYFTKFIVVRKVDNRVRINNNGMILDRFYHSGNFFFIEIEF
jgi:hypothetical protein